MKTDNNSIFKIGDLELKYRTVPAPMAGLTDIAFRKLLDEIGYIGYMISEMISADGLIRRNKRTFEMMKLHPVLDWRITFERLCNEGKIDNMSMEYARLSHKEYEYRTRTAVRRALK